MLSPIIGPLVDPPGNPLRGAGLPWEPRDSGRTWTPLFLGSRVRRLLIGGAESLATSGGKVVTWFDRTANGYNVTQGTADDRPTTTTIDGKLCPLFDDTDFLAGTATLDDLINAAAYHTISVHRPDTIALDNAAIYQNHVASANAGLDWGGAYRNVSGTTPGFAGWHYDGAFKTTTFSPVTAGTVYVVERKYDGTTISARAGTGSFQTGAAGNVSNGLASAMQLGRVASGQGFVGAYCFDLVCDGLLTDAEVSMVRAFARGLFPSAVG